MSTTDAPMSTSAVRTHTRSAAYSVLVGLAALDVLLQAVWAGLFVHAGQDYQQNWVSVHATGADVGIGLAALATVVAVVKLRSRLDLLIGSAALTVLLLVEAYIGGLIGDHAELTAIHIPLAMALMALVVWLPLRARR